MDVIILAGGFGTRLKTVISHVPKPMAPIKEKPFLHYILKYLKHQGITRAILSVCHQHIVIQEYFRNYFDGISIAYSIEDESLPLKTGGAIKKSMELCEKDDFLVVNGDTFFDVNLNQLFSIHTKNERILTLGLKPMEQFDRHGIVSIDSDQKITAFEEKGYCESGLINGGAYAINKKIFSNHALPASFSFEEFIKNNQKISDYYGFVSNGYFIDIGIPKDYKIANKTLLNY